MEIERDHTIRPGQERPKNTSDHHKQPPTPSRTQAGMAPRWAAIIGILASGLLYAALPHNLKFGPDWLLLIIEVLVLIPLLLSSVTNRGLSQRLRRTLVLLLLGLITLALAAGVILLIVTLPANKHADSLLRSAGLLWAFNVLVFASWYFEIDGGGPLKRHQAGHQAADFMFPQQVNGNDGSWAPHFLDYLFLAFTGATALSPADTYPLSRPAKVLMMLEALLSLLIVAVLASRAINILGS